MQLFQSRVQLPDDEDDHAEDTSLFGLCGCLRRGGLIRLPEDALPNDLGIPTDRMNADAGQFGRLEGPSHFLTRNPFGTISPRSSLEGQALRDIEHAKYGGDTESLSQSEPHPDPNISQDLEPLVETEDIMPNAKTLQQEPSSMIVVIAEDPAPSSQDVPFLGVDNKDHVSMGKTAENYVPLVVEEHIPELDKDEAAEAAYQSSDDRPATPTQPVEDTKAEQPTESTQSRFPATFLTRTPFPIADTSSPQGGDTLASNDTTMSVSPRPSSSSVAAVAHSILGDRLEDFTEKLAFIKKNITMKYDDSEDEASVDGSGPANLSPRNPQRRRPSLEPVMSIFARKEKESDGERRHRRARSFMDVAGPSIARFVNQFGGGESQSGDVQSPFNTLAGPASIDPSQHQDRYTGVPLNEEEEEDGDEEDLFDFSKVVTLGKNMRKFSEGMMDNGIRMFNDVATRVKNANQHDGNGYILGSDPYL